MKKTRSEILLWCHLARKKQREAPQAVRRQHRTNPEWEPKMAPARTFKKTDPGTAKVCNRAASEHGVSDQAKNFG